MTRHGTSARVLATLLAGLAGFVDAIGFLSADGLFVSFMSGNSTRLAVDGVAGSSRALLAAGLIGLFVLGAAVGSFTAHGAGHWQRPAVLALVALLLTGAAAGPAPIAIGLLALAMGAENSVFERADQSGPGLTYVTGALVRVGQGVATWARTGKRPAETISAALLWAGLIGGAVLGAFAFTRISAQATWIAAGVAGSLALFTCLRPFREG